MIFQDFQKRANDFSWLYLILFVQNHCEFDFIQSKSGNTNLIKGTNTIQSEKNCFHHNRNVEKPLAIHSRTFVIQGCVGLTFSGRVRVRVENFFFFGFGLKKKKSGSGSSRVNSDQLKFDLSLDKKMWILSLKRQKIHFSQQKQKEFWLQGKKSLRLFFSSSKLFILG